MVSVNDLASRTTFMVGTRVRVRAGIPDPDYPDLPIGGWSGTIIEIAGGQRAAYLVQWCCETLRQMHPVYHARCVRDDLAFDEMWLALDDLLPDLGGPLDIEQPRHLTAADQSAQFAGV